MWIKTICIIIQGHIMIIIFSWYLYTYFKYNRLESGGWTPCLGQGASQFESE